MELQGLEYTPRGPFTPEDYASSVEAYLARAALEGSEEVLRPHQLDVFADLPAFYRNSDGRGIVELPTGTGKTPLFTRLTSALTEGYAPGRGPRFMISTSRKDLVHQILGRSGQKGYGRFAPDLRISSFFSDTTDRERHGLYESDGIVTTYPSMGIMSRMHEMIPRELATPELVDAYYADLVAQVGGLIASNAIRTTRSIPTGRRVLDTFDQYFLDEGHNAHGPAVQAIVKSILSDKFVIAFTATPDANDEKRLSNFLPYLIHRMGLSEAIRLKLLSPIVAIGVKSGVRIEGDRLYDEHGEYMDERIGYLARDPRRNQRILGAATILAKAGVGTLVSCIGGGNAWHAKHIAEQLKIQGIPAAAVHHLMPTSKRARIYEAFEDGKIKVLTYIDVLGEGWDSDRAKGLVNGRPVRSYIRAKQRPGRADRPGGVAFTIDVIDEVESGPNPPITVADVIDEGPIAYGQAVGEIPAADRRRVDAILRVLRSHLPVLPYLETNYSNFQAAAAALPKAKAGRTRIDRDSYSLLHLVNTNYDGVTAEVIGHAARLAGVPIVTRQAVHNGLIKEVYSVSETQRLLYKLPEVDPSQYYIDADDNQWLAAEGLVRLFSKRYPNVTEAAITSVLDARGKDAVNAEWIVGRQRSQVRSLVNRFKVIKLYRPTPDLLQQLNEGLRARLVPRTWNHLTSVKV